MIPWVVIYPPQPCRSPRVSSVLTSNPPRSNVFGPIPFVFTLLRTLLHSSRTQPIYFQALPHSLPKNTRGGGTLATSDRRPADRERWGFREKGGEPHRFFFG